MGQGEGAAWKTVGHHSSHKIVLPSQDGLDWPGLEKCKVKGAFIASEAAVVEPESYVLFAQAGKSCIGLVLGFMNTKQKLLSLFNIM